MFEDKLNQNIKLIDSVNRVYELGGIIYDEGGVITHLSLEPRKQAQMISFFTNSRVDFEECSVNEAYHWMRANTLSKKRIIDLCKNNPNKIIDFYQRLYENPIIRGSERLVEKMLLDIEESGLKTPDGFKIVENYGYCAGQRLRECYKHHLPRYRGGQGDYWCTFVLI